MKTIYRTLMNEALVKPVSSLEGRIIDFASGTAPTPSYHRFLQKKETIVVRVDAKREQGEHVDFNKPLPYPDESFDGALFINALYIADDPVTTLNELRRILKKSGRLVLVVPFIFPEHREPHDYLRWTSEGIGTLMRGAKFSSVEIIAFGGQFTSAAYLVEPFLMFRALRWLVREVACRLDALIPKLYRESHGCPLGYVVTAKS